MHHSALRPRRSNLVVGAHASVQMSWGKTGFKIFRVRFSFTACGWVVLTRSCKAGSHHPPVGPSPGTLDQGTRSYILLRWAAECTNNSLTNPTAASSTPLITTVSTGRWAMTVPYVGARCHPGDCAVFWDSAQVGPRLRQRSTVRDEPPHPRRRHRSSTEGRPGRRPSGRRGYRPRGEQFYYNGCHGQGLPPSSLVHGACHRGPLTAAHAHRPPRKQKMVVNEF